MLDRYALRFSNIIAILGHLESSWENQWLGGGAGPLARDTEEQALHRARRARTTLETLEDVRRLCEQIGLTQITPEIARLYTDIRMATESAVPLSRSPKESLRHLRERIKDELAKEYFVHVPREDCGLYGTPEPFGPKVTSALAASEDLEAAGSCLALGQPTACVFHLMRVMEKAVLLLGRKLRVKFDPAKDSWFFICNQVGKAAINRPAKTARQRANNAAIGAAASHLNTVRLAWRNEVMHPKQTYTQDEAREVYNACRSFLTDLAELV